MAYTKQTWNDDDPATPLSAERLTHIEQGIADAHGIAGGGVFDGDSDGIAEGEEHLFMTAAERTKLGTVEGGATQNATDAQLRDRGTHTGTQAISTVTGLQTALDAKLEASGAAELIRDTMGTALVAGANVTITPDDGADTITISASGGGGGDADPALFARYVMVSTGTEARPSGAGLVIWVGGESEPVNMTDGDFWFAASGAAPATAPTITTTTLSGMADGIPFSQTLVALGSTPITWAVTSGALPAGLTLGASNGIISGTPTASGAYSFVVTASNSVGNDTQAYSGTVAAAAVAPNITTTSLNTLTQGSVFSQTLAATGTAPIGWSVTVGSLPAGLSLNAGTGAITGTPTTAGSYSFTITATNSAGTDVQAFSGTITAGAVAPTILTETLDALALGVSFSQTLAATGTAPFTWSVTAGTLPAGLALNSSTGDLTGTPSGTGSYSFTVTATNSAGNDTQAYSGTISATVPTITTTSLSALTEDVPFNQTLAATGSTPITWSVTVGSLPTGLSLNSSTGAITGTPTTAGSYSFTVTATNAAGSDTQAFSGNVTGDYEPNLELAIGFEEGSGSTFGAVVGSAAGTIGAGSSFDAATPNSMSTASLLTDVGPASTGAVISLPVTTWPGFSLSFWLHTPSEATRHPVVLFSSPTMSLGTDVFGVYTTATGDVGAWTQTSDGDNPTTVTNSGVLDALWNHVAATYGDGFLKIYIDGVLQASIAGTEPLALDLGWMELGRSEWHSGAGTQRDDIRIHSYVLDATEISALMTVPAGEED